MSFASGLCFEAELSWSHSHARKCSFRSGLGGFTFYDTRNDRFSTLITDADMKALARYQQDYEAGSRIRRELAKLKAGERFNRSIIDYLHFARAFNEQFPGFETDIHGLVKDSGDGKVSYYVDCVR